jgi:hypothetical protein
MGIRHREETRQRSASESNIHPYDHYNHYPYNSASIPLQHRLPQAAHV